MTEVGDIKPKPVVTDARRAKMMEQVTEQLEKKMLKKEKAEELGLGPDGEELEVPPEVPKLCFLVGANLLSCDKFNLSDTEARLMAKCLTTLFPRLHSKVYSIVVITAVTGYKLTACKEAVRDKFKSIRKGFKLPGKKSKYDEKKQAVHHG